MFHHHAEELVHFRLAANIGRQAGFIRNGFKVNSGHHDLLKINTCSIRRRQAARRAGYRFLAPTAIEILKFLLARYARPGKLSSPEYRIHCNEKYWLRG